MFLAIILQALIKWFNLLLCVFALQVLHQTFPQHTFLMNGLIHGVKVRDSTTRQYNNWSDSCVSL